MARRTMFIKKAIKRPGGLHASLGISPDKKIPKEEIREAAAHPEKFKKTKRAQSLLRRQANLALTLEKLRPKK